jgi:hypothetical protein
VLILFAHSGVQSDEKYIKVLTEQWLDYKGGNAQPLKGVRIEDRPALEDCFNVSINAYSLNVDNSCLSLFVNAPERFMRMN